MFIYKITNCVNGKIYIGQHNNKRRASYFGGGKLLKYSIKKYGKENFKREIIADNIENQDLLDYLEKHFIRLYASTFRNRGYNIQAGGFGKKNIIISNENKEKLRNRMLGNTIMNGRKLSEETKKKQIESRKAFYDSTPKEFFRNIALKSAKTRAKLYDIGSLISASKQKNKKLDWNNNQTKPVIQETRDGKFIKLWASAYQAHKEMGYLSGNISGVCYKKYGQKTYKGFNWRFATEEDLLLYKNAKNRTKKK